jgi:hypothetical protein
MNGHPIGCQCAACLAERLPAITMMYMAQTPPDANPAGTTWTFTTWPDSPELIEIRKLREDVAKLAKTCDGMRKLVERFLTKGKK